MTMEFFCVGIVMLMIGMVIDIKKNVIENKPKLWFLLKLWAILLMFFVTGIVLEQIIIQYLGIDELISSIWIFNIPFELLFMYLTFLYVFMMIYYGFAKDKIEDKLLSPFQIYLR